MLIEFERSGGFANVSLSVEADTKTRRLVYGAAAIERQLSEAEARNLEELVMAAGFSALSEGLQPGQAADRFQYRIAVVSSGKRQALQFAEAATPLALQPLIETLTRLARGQTIG